MQDKETARIEAFSDGVFAIAITLLVLEIKVPLLPHDAAGSRALLHAILGLWPSFVAFTLSFGTILIMWVNHHGLFRYARRADNRLMYANGFLLFMVTFVPFPTAVLAEYLDKPAANAAAAFYCGLYVLIGVGYNVLWHAVVHSRAGAASTSGESAAIARIRAAYRIGFVIYLSAMFVAMVNGVAGLAITFSLWFLWALLDYQPHKRH